MHAAVGVHAKEASLLHGVVGVQTKEAVMLHAAVGVRTKGASLLHAAVGAGEGGCAKEAHRVRVQIGVRFQRRGFRSPIRARSQESESKEESGLALDPGVRVQGGVRLALDPGVRVQGGVRSGRAFT